MTKTFFFFLLFFFEECSLFSFNNLGLTLGITLKFYTFVEVNLEKLVRDLSAPILNMVKLYVTQIVYKKIGLFFSKYSWQCLFLHFAWHRGFRLTKNSEKLKNFSLQHIVLHFMHTKKGAHTNMFIWHFLLMTSFHE